MSYYPSSPSKVNTPGNGLLRVLGALLSLTSIALAILGAVYQHSVLSLIFSVFIALFAVRVFVLWLSSNRVSSQPSTTVVPPAMYSMAQYNAWEQSVAQGYNLQTAPDYNSGNFEANYSSPTPYTPVPSYHAQPVYALQSSAYTQAPPTAVYEQSQGQSNMPQVSYVPQVQDALFMLDMPTANERCFMLAKEGKPSGRVPG